MVRTVSRSRLRRGAQEKVFGLSLERLWGVSPACCSAQGGRRVSAGTGSWRMTSNSAFKRRLFSSPLASSVLP